MRIASVSVYPLTKIRYKRTFKIARGLVGGPNMKWGFHVIVKVTTDEGIVGIGEVRPNNPHQGETTWSVVEAIRRFYAPTIIGRDPTDIVPLNLAMDAILPDNPHARTPIDFALYDILGKAAGMPVYQLIGGLVHDKVPLKFPIGSGAVETMVEEGHRIIAETGSHYFKIKIGPLSRLEIDLEVLEAIRQEFGASVQLQLDANASYLSPWEALSALDPMMHFKPVLVEQPLPKWDLEGMAQIVGRLPCPILADESVWSPHDAFRALRMGACDVINIKVPKAGGITGAKNIAAVADAAGSMVFVGSTTETGIGGAAGVHFYASTPRIWPAAACMFGTYMLVDDLVTDDSKVTIQDGYALPPRRPGLGVEIDEDALQEYSEDSFTITASDLP